MNIVKSLFDSELSSDKIKYLKKNGDDKYKVNLASDKKFKMILAVPALREFENIKRFLFSLSRNEPEMFEKTLVLFIINNTESASEDIKEDNRRAMEFLEYINSVDSDPDPFINEIVTSGLNTAYIDASSPGNGMPDKTGGVGLARKIGMDLALTLFDYSEPGKKIIACPDADCVLEPNYLNTVYDYMRDNKTDAAYVDYRHLRGDDETNRAITCYEVFLHYYVFGLKAADSPYAFHTIGSTMICSDEAYVKIQGMNKRKAAEDFYFMEKLSKNYPVEFITDTCIYPSPRPSFRVPFGTGQRVTRHLSGERNEYMLYNFDSFLALKNWNGIFLSDEILSAAEYLKEAEKIHPSFKEFLEINDFAEQWSRIVKNSASAAQVNRQKKTWFDGFRTLKLIHYLRDNSFPPRDMFPELNRAFAFAGEEQIKIEEVIPDHFVQYDFLDKLRKLNGHPKRMVY